MAYDKNVHAVLNTTLHEGTINGTAHTQVMVYDGKGTKVDCDNGTLVYLGNYLSLDTTIYPNYEVYKASLNTAKTSEALKNVVIVSAPELIYDESVKYTLQNYYNEAGKPVRAYYLKNNSVISLSKEGFSDPDGVHVGQDVYVVGSKLVNSNDGYSGEGVKVGHIESEYIYDYITMYQVKFSTDID